jgi:O-antigen/teichoic acid export membrane protein
MAVFSLRLVVQVSMLFLLARYLGPAQFGAFAGVAALAVGLGTLSSFGLGFVVLSETARTADAARQVVPQAAGATLLSAVILAPVYLLLSDLMLGNPVALPVLLLLGASEFVLMPWLLLLVYRLQGLGRVASGQLLILPPLGLRLAGLAALAVWVPESRLIDYAVIYATATLAGLLLAMWRVRSELPLRPRWPGRSLLRQGMGYAVMNFTAVNPTELDKSLALRLLGGHDAGLYALASRSLAFVTLPVGAMVLSVQPRVLARANEPNQGVGRLVALTLGVSFGFGCLAGAALYLAAPTLIAWAMGDGFDGIAKATSQVALIAPFLTARIAGGGILQALRAPWQRTVIELTGLLALLSFALALAPGLGLAGVVYAVLVSEALMALASALSIWHRLGRRAGGVTPTVSESGADHG